MGEKISKTVTNTIKIYEHMLLVLCNLLPDWPEKPRY